MNRSIRRILATVGLASVLLGTAIQPVFAASSDWPSRYLAQGGIPAIAVDANGRSHIAYSSGLALRYLTDASGAWVDTKIATVDGLEDIDLAIDGAGAVHVAYGQLGGISAGLWYATNRTGSWQTVRVSANGSQGVGIAVDTYGEVHAVVGSGGAIDYYTNRKGYFKGLRLAASNSFRPDIALTPDRRIHVVFAVTAGEPGIHEITNVTGAWNITRLSTTSSDAVPSIALAASGAVHVAYARSGADQGIKYTTNATGVWLTTSASTLAGDEPNLALYGSSPRIAFNASGIRLAMLSGTTWSTARVSERGVSPSLALSSTGERRIAYVGQGVLLATSAVPVWTTVQSSLLDDRQASTVKGPSDSLHLAWGRSGAGQGIFYRTNATGTWVSARVTGQADVQPSIGVDTAGHAYIAFQRNGTTWQTSGVFMATNVTGLWVVTRIREGTDPEEYGDTADGCPSLVVDPAGHVQVVMYDTTTPGGAGFFTPTLALFSNATGSWVRTQIAQGDPGADVYLPACATLAVDGGSKAHVAWRNEAGVPAIMYSTNKTGSFVTTSIGTGGAEPSITVTPGSKAYVAFAGTGATPTLEYMTNATGSWVRSSIAAPSLASPARPAIALFGSKIDLAFPGSDGTYYGTNRSGKWVFLRLSSNIGDHPVGEGLSRPGLVLDSLGKVRIAFTRDLAGVWLLSN
jgi:hypothetical protein